jgi:hypothetical protein
VARRCVWSRNLENEEAKARNRAVKIQPKLVVTAGKQTNKQVYYKGSLNDRNFSDIFSPVRKIHVCLSLRLSRME